MPVLNLLRICNILLSACLGLSATPCCIQGGMCINMAHNNRSGTIDGEPATLIWGEFHGTGIFNRQRPEIHGGAGADTHENAEGHSPRSYCRGCWIWRVCA